MFGSMRYVKLISNCSSLQKMEVKSPNIVSISKNVKEKEETIFSIARKEEMFNL